MFVINCKSHCCNDTASKEYLRKKNTNYFYVIRISISLAICFLKFSFKLVTFSKSYARKQKWVFFSEHSVIKNI